MSNRKPGLLRDQHTELGVELRAMRDRLSAIAVQLDHAYPGAIAEMALRAQSDVDRLRSKLDDIVCREYSGLSAKGNISVYYSGGARDAEEAR